MAKVLVIDDDRDYLAGIEALLRDAGHEVTSCSESVQAPKKLSEGKFDCVLLDYRMPQLDGQDVLSLIRAKDPKVPVVICTGYAGGEEATLRREGAFQVLQKPFSSELLFETIRQATSSEEESLSFSVRGYRLKTARDTVTRKLIVKALSKTRFNVTQAAKLLGVSRQALLRSMKRFEISR